MFYLVRLISLTIDIYVWIIIAEVILSWLLVFGVINTRNPQARNLMELINKATSPVMSRVRKYIPPIGGMDLTPIVVIIALNIIQKLIWSILI